jgi:hypothetical protein
LERGCRTPAYAKRVAVSGQWLNPTLFLFWQLMKVQSFLAARESVVDVVDGARSRHRSAIE